MIDSTISSKQDHKSRSMRDLLLWLALLPVIFGSLLCCGQLALLFVVRFNAVDTSSRLSANYMPWPYDLIPAINLPALIEDIQRDDLAMGNPSMPTVIVAGTFWVPPTTTAISVAQTTGTPGAPPTFTQTTEPPNSGTATNTPEITATVESSATGTATTRPTSSSTPTVRPSSTPSPTPNPTRTPTRTLFVPSPTPTQQQQPPPITATFTHTPTITRTPTRTSTRTLTPTITQTPTQTLTPTNTSTATQTSTATAVPNTPTFTFTPTNTLEPTAIPTYAPVLPIAESDGAAAPLPGGRCEGYFTYWNQNPQVVNIPLGGLNYLSEENVVVSPEQPTEFRVGQIYGAFRAEWSSGSNLIWTLDGRQAVLYWCNPPE